MAKIHIENGKISSSGDYGLYHGTSQIASIDRTNKDIQSGKIKFKNKLQRANRLKQLKEQKQEFKDTFYED